MPSCTEEFGAGKIDFGRLGRRVVEGRFDGGSMTSDGGVMLLGGTDRKLGLMDAAARCIPAPTESDRQITLIDKIPPMHLAGDYLRP